jgi:LmbE family N-acetylglucosaminyl deacetylase
MRSLTLESLRSVLCLGAHGDDVELGAGGTLLRLLSAHPETHVRVVVFSGTTVRAAEVHASIQALAGSAPNVTVDVHSLTDGFFPAEWARLKEVFQALAAAPRPDLILTHHRDDRHQDHRTVAELTWNTFRDDLILEYEIPKFDGELGQPNVYVPIAESDRRRKADIILEHYRSQHDKHWLTRETIDALMRLRGIECRSPTGYAEAFHGRKIVVGC